MIRRQLCEDCCPGVPVDCPHHECESCLGVAYIWKCSVCGDQYDEEQLRDLHDIRTLDMPACLPCLCETDAAAAIAITIARPCWHCRRPGCRTCPTSGNCILLGCAAPGCRREERMAAE